MSDETNLPAPQGQFLIYTDGASRLQVRLDGNTVWLAQKLIAELYGVSVKTVNEHLVNIYSEAELRPEATIRNFRIVQREGTRDVSRNVEHYSLDQHFTTAIDELKKIETEIKNSSKSPRCRMTNNERRMPRSLAYALFI